MTTVKGKTIVYISEWPSWLNKGHKRHIDIFNELFYSKCYVQLSCTNCKLCKQEFGNSFWYHMLYVCTEIPKVDPNPMWQAFCKLLRINQRGIAMYTCFPLLCHNYQKI